MLRLNHRWGHFVPIGKAISFLLCMLLFCQAIMAQSPAKFSGIVTDSASGEKLARVTISIKGSLQGGSSDDNGYFELDVSGDRVTLEFSRVGYMNKVQVVEKGKPAFGSVRQKPGELAGGRIEFAVAGIFGAGCKGRGACR